MLKAPTLATDRTNWCGPTALAILTGLPYDEVYPKMVAAINRDLRKQARERGLRPNYWTKAVYKGVSIRDIRVAGARFGIKIEWSRDRNERFEHKGVTLLTFVREHTVKGQVYLVDAGNHYVVVKDGIVYDNTRSGPHPIESYPRAKLGRLTCYAKVKPRPAAVL